MTIRETGNARRRKTARSVWTACSLLPLSLAFFIPAGYATRSGTLDAQRDLRHGVLAYETFGLAPCWDQDCAKLLRERYGIEQRTVAGCVVDDKIATHADAYNKIMIPEIERRFGTNIWKDTEARAKELYSQKNEHH